MVETPNGTLRRNSFHFTSAPRQEADSWPEDEETQERDEQQPQHEPAEDQSSPETTTTATSTRFKIQDPIGPCCESAE
jgi:hypothetical protein